MATTAATSSTLDVPSLVTQLMAVERRPIDKLNTQITSYQTKISSFGTISGLVSSLQTAVKGLTGDLQSYNATSSDTNIFSASATSAATVGSYSLEVGNLAHAQNLVATGQGGSTTPIGTGASTVVTFEFGTIAGTLKPDGTYDNVLPAVTTFTPNGTASKSITIDSTNNTLEGIRDAINAAEMGVSATIVNDGSASPYRLVLSTSSGETNSIKITTDAGDSAIDSLLANDPAGVQNLKETVTAQNANFTVNGIQITKTSNTVTDAIQGVSLTLSNPTTTPVSLNVSRNAEAASTAASKFVESYNALYSQLKTRSAYGTDPKNQPILAGDGTVRLMLDQLRSIFSTPASGGTMTLLSQVGITTQRDGTLALDSSKLNSAIASNYSDVKNLFASATGFATRLEAWSKSVLSSGNGLIANRTASLNKSINNYNDQISRLEQRMTAMQKQYTVTYSNLNILLSSMNSTSAYLTSQLSMGTSS